ncbi:SAM-dependent methyltransferase, MidA family [Asanoa hainanensis]|uniref:SAM-dependent methyltransferase, MidA family n=1 Tax=Asanoa hainanensis TaxID=560556 RepID=A0A239PHS0_9ACTN|nr:SAM-dependent methyltransferase [Asanoa hainanensis]SNT66114.1 SAM-dependent methyltransferase, MidA family [Asanoa hainanensis]
MRWSTAMSRALYGSGGFFVSGAGPAGHFRTSANASPVLAAAVLRLLDQVDKALGRPDRLDFVDVGAGRGELLTGVLAAAPTDLLDRLHPVAVELAPRPAFLPDGIDWQDTLPKAVTGLLIATEWLDNVPLDVAQGDRYLEVDPATGEESVGGPLDPADAAWLDRWWPALLCIHMRITGSEPTGDAHLDAEQEARREVGRARDEAWGRAVGAVERGLAVAVDYGHLLDARPFDGTLTGYRDGRQVPPVPDGSRDVTAHLAIDAVAAAGSVVAGRPYQLMTQRQALKALGAAGGRPPISLASTDPAGYVRALAAASAAAELTAVGGLGDHWWLVQPVGIDGWTWDDGGYAGSP